MSDNMFCFQCEQVARGVACTTSGVCGKKPDTSNYQDVLIGAAITLAHSVQTPDETAYKLIIESLFTTITNVAFDNDAINKLTDKVLGYSRQIGGGSDAYNMQLLWNEQEDIRSLKSLVLLGIKGMAAYAHHAVVLGFSDSEVNEFFITSLNAIADKGDAGKLYDMLMNLGMVNLKCMGLLDKANTSTYGTPVPVKVSTNIEEGPFIVVSGHDLKDLELLLIQTKDKGINIYTHGEMLPAHAYPKLKGYPHLKGNFGTAWQNQQKEFLDMPGAVLFTTNCLMPVRPNYADRVFTTEVVSHPGIVHIGKDKDFTPVINKALELKGYSSLRRMTGINGGDTLMTGFMHGAVLGSAEKVIELVKGGKIKRFLLVGGCDGAKPGRNYYTDFVKNSPDDTIILTVACGKFRFNDLDLGDIDGLPRILDMGQCNDSYSAIEVAIALSKAFNCSVNDLPLSIVLSWYEQKAVCVLLTLLALGIKNIKLGPTLPAFVSPAVLDILVDKFSISPITTAEQDLKNIFG